MALTAKAKEIKGLSLPDNVPEILVDGFDRASIVNEVARLNFFSMQAGPKGDSRPALVCRLAISLSALVTIRQHIDNLVDDLLKQGLVKGADVNDS